MNHQGRSIIKSNILPARLKRYQPGLTGSGFSEQITGKYGFSRRTGKLPALIFLKLFGPGVTNQINRLNLNQSVYYYFHTYLNFYSQLINQPAGYLNRYLHGQKPDQSLNHGETGFLALTRLDSKHLVPNLTQPAGKSLLLFSKNTLRYLSFAKPGLEMANPKVDTALHLMIKERIFSELQFPKKDPDFYRSPEGVRAKITNRHTGVNAKQIGLEKAAGLPLRVLDAQRPITNDSSAAMIESEQTESIFGRGMLSRPRYFLNNVFLKNGATENETIRLETLSNPLTIRRRIWKNGFGSSIKTIIPILDMNFQNGVGRKTSDVGFGTKAVLITGKMVSRTDDPASKSKLDPDVIGRISEKNTGLSGGAAPGYRMAESVRILPETILNRPGVNNQAEKKNPDLLPQINHRLREWDAQRSIPKNSPVALKIKEQVTELISGRSIPEPVNPIQSKEREPLKGIYEANLLLNYQRYWRNISNNYRDVGYKTIQLKTFLDRPAVSMKINPRQSGVPLFAGEWISPGWAGGLVRRSLAYDSIRASESPLTLESVNLSVRNKASEQLESIFGTGMLARHELFLKRITGKFSTIAGESGFIVGLTITRGQNNSGSSKHSDLLLPMVHKFEAPDYLKQGKALSDIRSSINNPHGKFDELLLKKPLPPRQNFESENEMSLKEEKKFSTSNTAVTNHFNHEEKEITISSVNRIADQVYKILEKKLTIEKDRRGLR